MTTNVLGSRSSRADQAPNTAAVASAALSGALTSAAFIVGFGLLSGQSQREQTFSPYSITVNVLTSLAFAILAWTIPSLARVVDVPRWVMYSCAAACAAVASMSWSMATIAAHVATQVSDDEFTEFTTYLSLFPAPKMVLGLVGFVALGVFGWRRRSVPRGACVLLILGGLTSLWFAYPPATIFVGIAFAWIAKSVDADTAAH